MKMNNILIELDNLKREVKELDRQISSLLEVYEIKGNTTLTELIEERNIAVKKRDDFVIAHAQLLYDAGYITFIATKEFKL